MKLKLLLFMGVFSALSSDLSARDKVLSILPPPSNPPTIKLAEGQPAILTYCPGSPIANIEIVVDDDTTLFKDLLVTFASSNETYIDNDEITAYPTNLESVTNGQRYLGITGNTIIPANFVNGFTVITITVTDTENQTASVTVRINIEDLLIPTIVKTGAIASGAIDKTLSSSTCDYTLEDFTGNVTVSDDCTDTPDIVVTQVATLNSITYNIGDTIPGQDGDVVTVSLIAEDKVGKTNTTTFTITLQDETAPVLAIVDSEINEELDVDATDCNFTIKDYLSNVTLDEACTPGATITQTPAAGTVVDYAGTNQEQTITFTCTDAAGNAATPVTFTVKINDNTNPVAKSLAVKTVNLSSTINGGIYTFTGDELNAGSTDNCSIDTYTYLPAFVECDVAGTTISVTMTVTDLSGNTATSSTDVTVLDTTPPVIGFNDIVIGTPTCLTLLLSDPTNDLVLEDNCTVLPSTLIGKRSDDLDLFTDPYPFGTTTITWTVQDSFGNGATVTQKVTMNDNEFPEFVDADVNDVLPPSTLNQSVFTLTYANTTALGSTDVYPAAKLLKPIVTDATDYTGCVEVDEDIDLVPTPEFLHLGTNTVTWTATDLYGTIVSATQVVTIEDNTVPVIILKAPITKSLGSNGQVEITPADLDNGTIDEFNGNALKLTVVPSTFGCESVGKDVTVTFFAEDYRGGLVGTASPDYGVVGDVSHKVYKQTTVRIEDTTNPTISTSPVVVNTNSGCTWNGTLALPTTADNCSVASVTSDKAADFAYPVGVTTVSWTVTDAAGLTAIATQTVTVNDVEKPVITANGDKFVTSNSGCGATAIFVGASATATDNCNVGSPVGTRSDFLALTADYQVGTTTITWNVTDANSNAAVAVIQQVVVRDTQNPVIAAPANSNVTTTAGQCGWTPSGSDIPSATATDNCTVGIPTGKRSDNLALTALYPIGTTTITWTVTDANGNVAYPVTTAINVKDVTGPTVVVKNIELVLYSGSVTIKPEDVLVSATDACGVNIMSYSLDKSTFTIADVSNSPITISLTVKDIYGNTTVTPVLVTFPIQIVTTQVLTPNGDGYNDTWIVENITNNPNSVVRVFNRWGSLVYSAKNYQNDWDGKLNGSDVTVPDGGSYYYQIDLKGTGNVDSEGWLYISRQ
jgi:gliding motility-associated-like protein